MAWTTPKSWTSTMAVAGDLNTHIRDNLLVLSTHAHSGAAGMGSSFWHHRAVLLGRRGCCSAKAQLWSITTGRRWWGYTPTARLELQRFGRLGRVRRRRRRGITRTDGDDNGYKSTSDSAGHASTASRIYAIVQNRFSWFRV